MYQKFDKVTLTVMKVYNSGKAGMRMNKYYLAIDIGASSGRHILGWLEDGKIKMEEIYRFENHIKIQQDKLLWDTEYLFEEIINGMKKCKELNKIPTSIAIDTWAVDYVLLDENDMVLGDVYAYRDNRTEGMDKEVYKYISPGKLYELTGIQKQPFNTIYQLMADKVRRPGILKKARTFLMLPDYFNFLLTGCKKSEYTNATSTQFVDPKTKQWNRKMISQLGLPKDIFLTLKKPGTMVGRLKADIRGRVGFNSKVVLCASHDTASAVMAMPVEKGDGLYISSGTWSLMGVENEYVINNELSRKSNFTNEGGFEYRYRYLKNIMGLWMIQSVRHEILDRYTFKDLCDMAEKSKEFSSKVDVNCKDFLAPLSMIEAVKSYCRKTNQLEPREVGEIAAVIYQSLAGCYAETVKEIERITGKKYYGIYIIGGGSNADYLNRLTANATGKRVYAGPGEATACGNLMAQAIKGKEIADLSEARRIVMRSFEIKKYEPEKIK